MEDLLNNIDVNIMRSLYLCREYFTTSVEQSHRMVP